MSAPIEVIDDPTPASPELDLPRVRGLVIQFYKRHQPQALAEGLDVSSLVDWILENGLDKFNAVLKHNFDGKFIDPDENLGDTQRRFRRASMAITPDLFQGGNARKQQEHRIRRKLQKFYEIHDEKKLEEKFAIQFARLVNFGIMHGIPTLNVLLEKKYKDGLSEEDTASELGEGEAEPENVEPEYKVDRDEIDEVRLKADLTGYFSEVQAEDQNEALEENIDWVCRMGFEEWNVRSRQLYGRAFDDVLRSLNREPWCEMESQENDIVLQPDLEAEAAPVEEGELVTVAFDDMSDEAIKKELTAFYEFYDPDNLDKIDELVALCKKLGRDELNGYLESLYGTGLREDGKYVEYNFSATLERNKKQNKARMPEIDPQKINLEDIEEVDFSKRKISTLDKVEAAAEKGIEVEKAVPEPVEERVEVEDLGTKPTTGAAPKSKGQYVSEVDEEMEEAGKAMFKEKAASKRKKKGFGAAISRRLFGKKEKEKSLSNIEPKKKKKKVFMSFRRNNSVASQKEEIALELAQIHQITKNKVVKSVVKTEKRMKRKPKKHILARLKDGNDDDPLMMLSSRNMRRVILEDIDRK